VSTPAANSGTNSLSHFLAWEQESRDTIDFKKIYVDMAGDLLAGLLLSQIVFWHLPNKQGRRKLRVEREGTFWLAKTRDEWYDELRMIPPEVDRALATLEAAGLIETRVWKFSNHPTKHVRIVPEVFMSAWNEVLKGDRSRPKHKFQRDGQRGKKAISQMCDLGDTALNPKSEKLKSLMCDFSDFSDVENENPTCGVSLTETPSETPIIENTQRIAPTGADGGSKKLSGKKEKIQIAPSALSPASPPTPAIREMTEAEVVEWQQKAVQIFEAQKIKPSRNAVKHTALGLWQRYQKDLLGKGGGKS
jgi:hypothetical protein